MFQTKGEKVDGKETLRNASAVIEKFIDWAEHNYTYHYVEIEDDGYFVDLGSFGEQSLAVSLSNDNYEIDPQQVIEQAEVGLTELQGVRDDLDELFSEYEEPAEVTLEAVLEQMSVGTPEEVRLAGVINAVVDAMKAPEEKPVLSVPAGRAPWPGALKEGIDYTAEDFGQKYLAPPGFVFKGYQGDLRGFTPGTGTGMFLDTEGRVTWRRRHDDLASGGRWLVWHEQDDARGIEGARGFSPDVPPRALNAYGEIMPERDVEVEFSSPGYNWQDGEDFECAKDCLVEENRRYYGGEDLEVQTPEPEVQEAAEAFAPPAEVTV